MATLMGSLTRGAARRDGDPLNIITFPTHERWQSGLAGTSAVYYMLQGPTVKTWNKTYAPLPANHILLDPQKGEDQLPPDVDFDLVLSQNKAGQYQIARQFAHRLHLPLVNIEHTLPMPQWGRPQLEAIKAMRGHRNVFISEYSVKNWGWDPADPSVRVIHHGVDTTTFYPNDMVCDRKPTVLSVVNDWKNRDWCMPAGQKVLTTRGYVPIEKVFVGAEVLSDDGVIHPVTKTFSRDYFGDMVVIRLNRDTELRFTPSHAIRVFRDGQWKYVESSRVCAGERLRFPRHQQTDFTFHENDRAWLVGLIVGDGSITDGGNISISFHVDERGNAERACSILREWIGHGAISERHRARGAQAISVDATARIFGEWLRPHIGGKSGEKRMPDFIMRGSDSVRLSALRGAWAADGSLKNGDGNSPRACYSTISPSLAAQVSELLHSFGVKCSVRRFKRTTNKSSGQVVPIYRVVAYGAENVERCRQLLDETSNYSGEPYQYVVESVEIETDWAGKVYNCEVAGDPSYVVEPGFVAHNCCGFRLWEETASGLPVVVVGATPGLSEPAKSVPDLVMKYRSSRVFLNTSLVSPVPTALMEAMACGCACVSTATAMIPEVIEHGVNGLLGNTAKELRAHCDLLLNDPDLARRLGAAARRTICERFSMGAFVSNWDRTLREAADIIYTGAI